MSSVGRVCSYNIDNNQLNSRQQHTLKFELLHRAAKNKAS
jgi:hypothetical protein